MPNLDGYDDWDTYSIRSHELSDDEFIQQEKFELNGDLYPEDDEK